MLQSLREPKHPYTWAAAIILSLGNLFLHKPMSDACDSLGARLGRVTYEWVMLLGVGALCLGAALPLMRRRARGLLKVPVFGALVGLAALTAAVQRWLVVSNVELIHFPQFALLTALLLAAGLPPPSAWLVATAAGIIDETYQHLVIYAAVAGTYYDHNDIVLNGIGAAWAVLLFGTGRPPHEATTAQAPPTAGKERRGPRRRLWLGMPMLVVLMVSWWIDPPQFSPLLRPVATGRFYHVLSAAEDLAILLALWGLIRLASGRRQEPSRRTEIGPS